MKFSFKADLHILQTTINELHFVTKTYPFYMERADHEVQSIRIAHIVYMETSDKNFSISLA